MNDELRRALDDLAARTTAEHAARPTGLPVAEMTAQARRRRGRRTAAVSGIALTAVAAVVAASTAVAGWDRAEPMPAAPPSPTGVVTSPTPTPSPTPVETPAPPVLPVGDPALPYGACGSLTSTPPALPVADPALSAWLVVDTPEVGTGGQVAVRTGWDDSRRPDGHVAVVDWAGPRLLVVADGVVVGMTDAYGGTDATTDVVAAGSFEPTVTHGSVDLRVCSAGDDALAGALPTGSTTALPPGAYSLVPVVRYRDLGTNIDDAIAVWDGTTTPDALAARPGTTAAVVVGDAQPFTVLAAAATAPPSTGPADPAALAALLESARSQETALPWCGSPAPAPTDLAGAVTLTFGSVTAAPGAAVQLQGTLRWDGPGRVRAGVLVAGGVLLVRDGVVVGHEQFTGDQSYFRMDLGAGAGTEVGGLASLESCDPSGATAVTGEYQAYPYVDLAIQDVRGAPPAGGTPSGDVRVRVVRPAVTLTVQP